MTRRRGKHEGSIHKRADGRWVAIVDVGYVAGKRKRKYLYGRTREEVARKLTVALKANDDGLPLPNERLTLGRFLDDWLEHTVKQSVRPRTFQRHAEIVRLHITPTLGRVPIARLQAPQVQRLINEKLESGLSPRSVQYIHAVLRHALNQAMRWSIVVRNVATLVTPPRAERAEIRPLDEEQSRLFIRAAKDDRLGALFTVALATGLRLSEMRGLRWADVDLERGVLTVRAQLHRVDGRWEWAEPKSARGRRTMILPRTAHNALRAQKVRQLEERLAMGSAWEDWGLVFTSTRGRPLDSSNVTRSLRKLLQHADLPRIRFHDLRHTAATLLLARGVSPRVVMETLGHSQISLTMNTYAHVLPSMRAEAARRMDDALSGP